MKNTIAIVLVDIGTIYLGGQTNNWNIFNIKGIKYNKRDKVQITWYVQNGSSSHTGSQVITLQRKYKYFLQKKRECWDILVMSLTKPLFGDLDLVLEVFWLTHC